MTKHDRGDGPSEALAISGDCLLMSKFRTNKMDDEENNERRTRTRKHGRALMRFLLDCLNLWYVRSHQFVLRLRLCTSGRLVERGFPYSQSPQGVTVTLLEASLTARENCNCRVRPRLLLSYAFINEPRTNAFEYVEDEQLLCEGDVGLLYHYAKKASFQEWTLHI